MKRYKLNQFLQLTLVGHMKKVVLHIHLWKTRYRYIHEKQDIVVVSFISHRIKQWYRNRKTFCKYQYSHDIETLLHSAGGHQGSRKAHQADNENVALAFPCEIFVCVYSNWSNAIHYGYFSVNLYFLLTAHRRTVWQIKVFFLNGRNHSTAITHGEQYYSLLNIT